MADMSYRDALNQALFEEMERDESVVIFGEDVALYEGSFKVTKGLLKRFGEKRVVDTPISEAAIVGMATGAAMGGLRPVPELMTRAIFWGSSPSFADMGSTSASAAILAL